MLGSHLTAIFLITGLFKCGIDREKKMHGIFLVSEMNLGRYWSLHVKACSAVKYHAGSAGSVL